MVSREHAERIAVEKLQLHGSKLLQLASRKVVSIEEITGRRPIVYIVGNVGIEDCWIVNFEQANFLMLCSSTIMLISRAAGEEVYFGSACAEG